MNAVAASSTGDIEGARNSFTESDETGAYVNKTVRTKTLPIRETIATVT